MLLLRVLGADAQDAVQSSDNSVAAAWPTFAYGLLKPMPGRHSSRYVPFDRDLNMDRNLDWYKAHLPAAISYACDGTTVSKSKLYPRGRLVPLNIQDDDVRRYQVGSYIDPATQSGFDAIFFDNVSLANRYGRCGMRKDGRFVRLYSGSSVDPVYETKVLEWMHAMRQEVHARHMTMQANVEYDTRRPDWFEAAAHETDVIMEEQGFIKDCQPTVHGKDWQAKFETLSRVAKFVSLIVVNYVCTPYTAITDQMMDWAIGNYLLVRGDRTYLLAISRRDPALKALVRNRISPPDDRLAVPLGEPAGDATRHGDLYVRAYSKGLVLVNPAIGLNASYELSGTYTDRQGRPVTGAITVPAATATILRRAE